MVHTLAIQFSRHLRFKWLGDVAGQVRFCAQQFFPSLTLFGFRNNISTLRFFVEARPPFSSCCTHFYTVLIHSSVYIYIFEILFLLFEEKEKSTRFEVCNEFLISANNPVYTTEVFWKEKKGKRKEKNKKYSRIKSQTSRRSYEWGGLRIRQMLRLGRRACTFQEFFEGLFLRPHPRNNHRNLIGSGQFRKFKGIPCNWKALRGEEPLRFQNWCYLFGGNYLFGGLSGILEEECELVNGYRRRLLYKLESRRIEKSIHDKFLIIVSNYH